MDKKLAIQAEIEDCLEKVRAALSAWAAQPQMACADCETSAPMVPVRIELRYDAVKGYTVPHSYEITNWSFEKLAGWLVVDNATSEREGRRHFCPECRKNRNL